MRREVYIITAEKTDFDEIHLINLYCADDQQKLLSIYNSHILQLLSLYIFFSYQYFLLRLTICVFLLLHCKYFFLIIGKFFLPTVNKESTYTSLLFCLLFPHMNFCYNLDADIAIRINNK